MSQALSEPYGLRERKKREAMLRIQEAALALCLEAGYNQVRAEDIAAKADVSPRTLFRYFPRKEDIFRDDDVAILDELSATLREREKGTSVIDALRSYAREAAQHYLARREFFVRRHRLFLSTPSLARHASAYRPEFVEALTQAVRKHKKVSPRKLRIAMGALEGAIDAALQEWLDEQGQPSLERLWSEALDMLEPMLREVLHE